MEKVNLFKSSNGKWLTNIDLLETLLKLEANKCDILYIHSSLSFGLPNLNLKHKLLLSYIYKIILELNVPTILMPTFTFSYCNGNIYDPINSNSKMGSLNEFFRQQKDVIRSDDPLMSVAIKGKDLDLATNITNHSIGDNSTFDMIHRRNNVKFLFLGTLIGDCFTYMHYLEWLYGVQYRYERRFVGTSIINGKSKKNEFDLFVRHNGVLPNNKSYEYENMMYKTGIAHKEILGNSSISIVDEKKAASAYKSCLNTDPYYFVNLENGIFRSDKSFILKDEMVAL